jgi:cell wall-associated NlpC family hydrolase
MPSNMTRACGLVAAAALALAAADDAHATFGDRALRQGTHGHDVRVLQNWLTRVGWPTHVDGRYGRRTGRNVRRFEAKLGRNVDGRLSRADARVLRALVEHPAPRTAPATGAATLAPDGATAIPPADAPPAVQAAIAAANRLVAKPYKWGGGHGRWEDDGYDCSGAVSYTLHGAGLLEAALDSSQLADWGEAGLGTWITVYGRADHAYTVIAGLRFDTSGTGGSGPRWHTRQRSGRGYTARHPLGL